ncbi:enoyl-CoA hydratase [Actinomadura atramentaria]|uniref:enoyl-CoA hydratase n=1 Tax=Actinomadura atramentaria TaxID=1990 RepID=UPI0004759F7D|nr:enoyl-CoA hydratase [Actinomadura atramentaria]
MTETSVRLESDGAVRHLVLDAPARRNALTSAMLGELSTAIAAVADDPDARALVVRAEGRAFCAGADVTALFGDLSRPTGAIRDDLKQVYASFLGLADLAVPTIAAVDGVAVGAGANIALACDMVVVGPRAKFAITFADIGLHPGGGATWFLTSRLGGHRAMATILDAETIDADRAMEFGLATRRADDPVAAATELARRCAERDPALVRDVKRAVHLAQTGSLPSVVEFESWAQAASLGRPAFARYVEDFRAR